MPIAMPIRDLSRWQGKYLPYLVFIHFLSSQHLETLSYKLQFYFIFLVLMDIYTSTLLYSTQLGVQLSYQLFEYMLRLVCNLQSTYPTLKFYMTWEGLHFLTTDE